MYSHSKNNFMQKLKTCCNSVKSTTVSKLKNVSLRQFLQAELTRGYHLENDKEQFVARREKIYSCMKILKDVEKFMTYGFFQCADSFLFVYTFLPIRFLIAFWAIIKKPIEFIWKRPCKKVDVKFLRPAETCDLLKGLIIIICSVITLKVDTSMMYHLVKSQSIIKLYIFYNMLEVGDRLFSAFGQDTIDALFWTATEPKSKKYSSHFYYFRILLHLCFAVGYVLLHSILVLFQATTLNVAINSNNKALLTIMMSNNFVELKGSVFKKFDKNNFFQLSCSDVRERFHLTMLLLAVTMQTMKEYAWHLDRLFILLPDCTLLLLAEILIDWVKHAFITRFNELSPTIYKEYIVSLAYDVAQTRQETAFSDSSDVIARRMSFIPLPLGVAIARVLFTTLTVGTKPINLLLLILGYFILVSLRILISLLILGYTCTSISNYTQLNVHTKNTVDTAYSKKPLEALLTNSSVYNKSSDPNVKSALLHGTSFKGKTEKILISKNRYFRPSSENLLSKNLFRVGSEPLLNSHLI
ncbi:protein TAPT1 homolog isoform X1 [Copidosoma floridanum]|uniref:protein TAPT1 homolog isoform X1 n=1 Tax=Copidosoma floridanum TaxID=29053 RepID=UPI0006C9C734|nr:protein TAPT1 homolog isoform X1 [Copidosoma floridanum]XP_014219039.1 protein TAPT1 homolog isoform X1 [Copidosoma floridanum]